LSDLEQSSGRHCALFHMIRQLSEPTVSIQFTEARQILPATKLYSRSLVFCSVWFMGVYPCYLDWRLDIQRNNKAAEYTELHCVWKKV